MNLKQLNEEIEQFLEEYKTSKLAASSDFSGKCDIIKIVEDNNDENQLYISFEGTEEIYLPDEEEYARVMSVLETWLKQNPTFNNKLYIQKEIQSTEYDKAFAYSFKKVENGYILTYKRAIDE